MNARLKKYYKWRIRSKIKQLFGIVNKELSIITPCYAYEQRRELLRRCIQSIINQAPHSLHIHHYIIFDGEKPSTIELPKRPEWYDYDVIETPRTGVYGAAQRNRGIALVEEKKRGFALFLDDDNELYPNAFEIIEREINASIGVLVFQVWHEELKHLVPNQLNLVPTYLDIDSLSLVVNADVVGLAHWQSLYHHDFLYAQNILTMSRHYGFETKVINKPIGIHH